MDLVFVIDGDSGEAVKQLQRAVEDIPRRRHVIVAAESRAQQVDDKLDGTCVAAITVNAQAGHR